MKTLALEMSTAIGTVAWHEEGKLLFDCGFAADRKHSGVFFENVQACLDRFGRPEQIIVGLGPGSYAGVRIAIATALGLRSATKAKLLGIPSICALDVDGNDYCVVGDARRQSFFLALVESGRVTEGPTLHSADDLRERMQKLKVPVFASEPLSEFLVAHLAYPSARRLVQIAPLYSAEIDVPLEPIYLREPHITIAKVSAGFAATR